MRAYQLKPPIKTQLVELCCSSLEAVYHHSSSCPSPPWSPPHLYNRPPIWSPFCWSSRLFLAQKKVPITIIGTMQVNCPGLEKHHSLKSGLTGRIYIYSALPSQFSKTDTGFSLQIIGEKSWKCDLRDTFKVWISASDLKKKKKESEQWQWHHSAGVSPGNMLPAPQRPLSVGTTRSDGRSTQRFHSAEIQVLHAKQSASKYTSSTKN